MPTFFLDLDKITGGKIISLGKNLPVTSLLTDSRKALVEEGAVFFSIAGSNHDAHRFIPDLYKAGIRQFVVERKMDVGRDANVLLVDSSIRALQQIAAAHRTGMNCPVIGITGSNGKTIVKEWLFQLLSPDFKISKNPASYNSQVGVPLSVWQLQPHHTLGIFEAGISKVGEMAYLQKVLQPTIGLFTNIGPAHSEGFTNMQKKIIEKLALFRGSEFVIYCKDHHAIDEAVRLKGFRSFTWGRSESADIVISGEANQYRVRYSEKEFHLRLPFQDDASVENSLQCLAVLLYFNIPPNDIQDRLNTLRAVPMRLELKEGINQCQMIDDTYNNDLAGLKVSLDFLSHQHQKAKKTLILSDILESGLPDETLVKTISALQSAAGVHSFIGVGPVLSSFRHHFPQSYTFYNSTDDFLRHHDMNLFHNEIILVKGARAFTFERIVNRLQRKVHGTVMEIDLGALVHNLNYFKSRLNPSTRIMAMVKAFAYGSGSNEIANVLQYHKISYLGVAYADEGVELRKNNISLPIMVMNPASASFETLLQHELEPEIYSFGLLESLALFLGDRACRIHVKIDTGMRRLGFDESDIDRLVSLLLQNPNIKVSSIFSHMAAADERSHDDFSREQAHRFKSMADKISSALQYRPLYHLLNSSGILRFPEFQFDMVRAGIGLYGIDPTETPPQKLRQVATLKTVISQIKNVQAGDTIGYGRKGRAEKPSTVATIAIGYADGFSRAFSQGVGKVVVNGRIAPVIGNVCMDMTMIDVTGIQVNEGDEVIVFGDGLPVQQVAESINTIAYEILTGTSERVKRVFVAESI